MICRDTPPMGEWLGVWVGQWVGQVKSLFNKSWPNWDNSILFEDLLFVETPHPWVGGLVVGWMGDSVGQWVGSGHMTKYGINLDLIVIIQFCLKIYDLLRHPHPWVATWVVGWMGDSVGQWVGSGCMTKYRINLNLIQFCLKIYD